MRFASFHYHRKSIRLQGYDYTQPGMYFVTVVSHRRMCIFGEIGAGQMRLNECGEIARVEWVKTGGVRPEIALDEFVIMPNYIHAIITIMACKNDFVATNDTNQIIESRRTGVGARRRRAPTVIEQFGKPSRDNGMATKLLGTYH